MSSSPEKKKAESASSTPSNSVEPKPSDILSGRGKATYTHPGNKRYLQVINTALNDYLAESTKVGKTAIVRGIVAQMNKEKRRFLQRDAKSDSWYELGRKAILDKVGHSLRDMKQTKLTSGNKKQSSSSSTGDGKSMLAPTDKNNKGSTAGAGQTNGEEEKTSEEEKARLAALGFASRLEAANAVARLRQQHGPVALGLYGGFPNGLPLGGLVPPTMDPNQLAMARSQALRSMPNMPQAAGPAGGPQAATAAGRANLDAILETTNMILKEREAIRALSANGTYVPGTGGATPSQFVTAEDAKKAATQDQQQQATTNNADATAESDGAGKVSVGSSKMEEEGKKEKSNEAEGKEEMTGGGETTDEPQTTVDV